MYGLGESKSLISDLRFHANMVVLIEQVGVPYIQAYKPASRMS